MGIFSFKKKNDSNAEGVETPSVLNVTEVLYKRNAELAIKNKALSLLDALYAISIQTVDAKVISEKAADAARQTLNLELTSVFLYDEGKNKLSELGTALSDRFAKALTDTGYDITDAVINNVSSLPFYENVIQKRTPVLHEHFGYILGSLLPNDVVAQVREKANIESSLVYPLALGNKVIGLLLINMNREYQVLPDYEKEIISNIANVITLALDKAMLYEELRIANEKLKDLDRLKTEFLSLASHQLRSPLTAVKGYTSMLLEGDFGEVNPQQKEAIDRVYQSVTHLTRVVEDLLNVTKIESGGMQYTMIPFDVGTAVEEIVGELSVTAEKKGLKLSFEHDMHKSYTIYGDEEKLRQVFLNFIDNSIKYTEKGEVRVSITKDTAHNEIMFAVTDTGMGMTPETKQSLFQKFARTNESKQVNRGGSGLGLYLAKQIVEAHHGRVEVSSPGVGKGSTFAVLLSIASPSTSSAEWKS
jgi:signal transduction histidine kinase